MLTYKFSLRLCIVIWLSHAAGVALFAKCLFPLTSTSLLGGSLHWP